MNKKLVNININFDSLFFPLSIDRCSMTDPSFFVIADRFFEFSLKYNFKYTIFIIGKDLENPEVAARVRSWAEAGHEIGNHSYTHNPNLGSLSRQEMEFEVMKSHELITNCIGYEPKGFISPSWSTSGDLIEILMKAGYIYDTSVFPSYFQYFVLMKLMFLTGQKHPNFHPSFGLRRDKLAFFFAPRRPYFIGPESLIKKKSEGLLMLPLPVATALRIPCWHTMYFVFGKHLMNWLLLKTIREHEYFYYLVHPKDLVNYKTDLLDEFKNKYNTELAVFESLKMPIEEKTSYMDQALSLLAASGRKFVTMRKMAENIIQQSKL
ncbi:MAG: hypothetical protein A2921_04160 [Candidatus Magasanikbacteria bacterium RIFCSPLOWO2_01_FULL_43_20b]|uniref:NodB homology domain-containing protein n=1 Tax=Candidatus Magasanikbacteria bacterium RIFCSPLOWO2_12_FULL_43_12 TaxID=1798692 RepID=A0A1F6MRI6_9BACT|nr:MAG: hypothetical protein A3C74_03000 [Candidatus Magasanikbacteria bacterium RIFCSPHIGHO2_02_FULL_44_13]OGH72670.1 MAG: hypothetical protein A3I93_00930 [Candidatus Magasanikbacteria bacterium RIFCSPLOWO2_02_FULL_43_22]OGH73267.1 MAG: hypothetical protein A2921_04160 [Candidatus Magasanikbacteria bacterium RIFCSPLOWO2_01_FULL_43_20b]OGH74274.1 MAG: hypothetical protein A3G00_02350 [Candidatus Magasanikbacteria bacterium RIFCSPLOWO2_12_FULL_43_12]